MKILFRLLIAAIYSGTALRDLRSCITNRTGWRLYEKNAQMTGCVQANYSPNGSSINYLFRLQVSASRYPVVVKLGHAHGGTGKARAETNQEFLDLASLAAMANTYCTAEPYIDTKYDVHVQKIGNNYKAFM